MVNNLAPPTCNDVTQLATHVTKAFDATMRNCEEALAHMLPSNFVHLREMDKIAVINHSMGSGIVLRNAMQTLRQWRNAAVHERGSWRQPPTTSQVGMVVETVMVSIPH